MRRKIVAGNWKMNLSPSEADKLFADCAAVAGEIQNVQLMVFPPALYLDRLINTNSIAPVLGAQNFHPAIKGAFTGEISISQFKALGVNYFLIGHSERREIFKEDNDFLKEKVNAAISIEAKVMFCCGEPLKVREDNDQMNFVRKQLEESLFHLTPEQIVNCSIAYEPVWAIGTGKTASSAQAEEMHAAIRSWLVINYGADIAESISLLYGGSCNPTNAKELFACPNVDGGLIGGASLEEESFIKIAQSF